MLNRKSENNKHPGKMVYIKKTGAKDGYKKAVVYLKTGDKIAI